MFFYKNVQDATKFLFDIGVESGFEIFQYVEWLLKIIRSMIKLMNLVYSMKWMLLNVFV